MNMLCQTCFYVGTRIYNVNYILKLNLKKQMQLDFYLSDALTEQIVLYIKV